MDYCVREDVIQVVRAFSADAGRTDTSMYNDRMDYAITMCTEDVKKELSPRYRLVDVEIDLPIELKYYTALKAGIFLITTNLNTGAANDKIVELYKFREIHYAKMIATGNLTYPLTGLPVPNQYGPKLDQMPIPPIFQEVYRYGYRSY